MATARPARRFRNTQAGLVAVQAQGAPTTTPAPTREFAKTADWYWNPVPQTYVAHANAATWATYMGQGVVSSALHDFGVQSIKPSEAAGQARVTMAITGSYGNPFTNETVKTVPMPVPTYVAPQTTTYGDQGDSHLTIADASNNRIYSFWRAVPQTNPRSAEYGGIAYLDGDGTEYVGSSTAANISRYVGIIRADEMQAAIANGTGLGHTLFVASDIISSAWVYPASKADPVVNPGGVATPVPMGARFILDRTVNVETVANATPVEKVIMRTLQTHGFVFGDKGGARFGLLFQYQNDANPGKAWSDMGLTDYADMPHIPRNKLIALANWNGAAS